MDAIALIQLQGDVEAGLALVGIGFACWDFGHRS